jgi:hypothetical protein
MEEKVMFEYQREYGSSSVGQAGRKETKKKRNKIKQKLN